MKGASRPWHRPRFRRSSGNARVTLKEPRQSCPTRKMQPSTQLSTLTHLSTVLPSSGELRVCGITATPRFAIHFARVRPKLPQQLLKPCVADAQLPSPSTTGRLLPATGVPQECVSPNHSRFVATAPGPRRTPLRPRFGEVSHRSFVRGHASLPPPTFSGVARLLYARLKDLAVRGNRWQIILLICHTTLQTSL